MWTQWHKPWWDACWPILWRFSSALCPAHLERKKYRERREVNYIIQIQHGCCSQLDYSTVLCRWRGHAHKCAYTHIHTHKSSSEEKSSELKHSPQRQLKMMLYSLSTLKGMDCIDLSRTTREGFCRHVAALSSHTHKLTLSGLVAACIGLLPLSLFINPHFHFINLINDTNSNWTPLAHGSTHVRWLLSSSVNCYLSSPTVM